MSDINKIIIDYKMNELNNILDSGTIKEAMAQFALVDSCILEILPHLTKTKTFETYLIDQLKIKETITELEKDKAKISEKQSKLINEYGDNARDIYEELKKL